MIGAATSRSSCALALAVGITVVCSLPVFLTGALAVQVSESLRFGSVGIGAAVSVFFGTVAVSSVHLGRMTDRVGATRSLRLSAVGSAFACLGIALLASSWTTYATCLTLAGLSQALAQPAANRMLVNHVRMARLGTAFGIKQAAPPTASILAGLSVPALALTIGWRWAYALTALSGLVLAFLIGLCPGRTLAGRARARPSPRAPLRDGSTLLVLGMGFGLAFAASSAVLAFYVEAAVTAGVSHVFAGLIFALGGAAVVVTRLVAGVACDHLGFTPLRLSATLLGVGALGLALLATSQPLPMTFGAVIALTGTWGFPGVFWFALVSAYAELPGRITGVMAPAATGGLLGPVGFGAVASTVGYAHAWALTAFLALLAGIAFLVGSYRLPTHSERQRRPQGQDRAAEQ